jgi:recombination protein RecA
MKIGVMFGSPETTTGGNALKFYASMRIDIRKIETLTGGAGNDPVGNRVRVKIVKNKMAPPFREVELDITFGLGISREGSILDAALKYNLIQKSGSWFAYGEKKIGQGRDNVKQFLQEHPEICKIIEEKIRSVLMPKDDDDEAEKEKIAPKKNEQKGEQKNEQKELL